MSTAMTTRHSRGTEGYRSPELLNDERPQYSTRSDIWGLGCVLHELATGRRVFRYDYATALHYSKEPLPEVPLHLSSDSKFWQEQIWHCLNQFLLKEPEQRPNAVRVSRRLGAYCTLFELSEMQVLANLSLPPSLEWENVVKPGTCIVELLLELGWWYLQDGQEKANGRLMQTIVSGLNRPVLGSQLLSHYSPRLSGPLTEFWIKNEWVLREIQEQLLEKEDDEVATLMFAGFVQNVPTSRHTLLARAAMDGDIFAIKVLLNAGVDVNKQDSARRTVLHWAAQKRHGHVIELLLQHNADVDKQDRQGLTALHLVAESGCEKAVELLLRHNADVDKRDFYLGWTALHWAARSESGKTIEALLRYNADVNKRDKVGMTALDIAEQYGSKAIVKTLRQYKNGIRKPSQSCLSE